MQKHLAKELTSLVNWSVTELGHVIRMELGPEEFNRIEKIRRYVKSSTGKTLKGLLNLKKDLEKISDRERFDIAHSFALMLELINACESAYRSFRLEMENTAPLFNDSHTYGRIIHVLTAHPTESRNPDAIYYFRKIHQLLINRLTREDPEQTAALKSLLRMAWSLPMSKQRKPSVMDEAEYIYSLALQDDVIDIFIKQREAKAPFYVRTWVGGDKDGHPGVNEKTLLGSLTQSRVRLLKWVEERFKLYLQDLAPLARSSLKERRKIQGLLLNSKKLNSLIKKVQIVKPGDSRRIQNLTKELLDLSQKQQKLFGSEPQSLMQIRSLLKVFPALVIPLELREDSALVHEALKRPISSMSISRMLQTLRTLCPDQSPRNYVRGFILSQCESSQDLTAGIKLCEKILGAARLPVVPLFESSHSLSVCPEIMEEFLKIKKNQKLIRRHWSSQVEVMLGYSDSAKENGSFPSRFLIQKAVGSLEKVIEHHEMTPIFFHGSGGSIERGGGSIQEQTEWWPLSALKTVKMTIQGEMIYRSYNSALILQRQLNLLVQNRDARKEAPAKAESKLTKKTLNDLKEQVQESYQSILKDPDFLELVQKATPYSFMKDLRMGSRPSKRQGSVQIKSLRAIPWVLCWTQTRTLFPTWWGVGSYWKTLNSQQKKNHQRAFHDSAMFRSYIKALGFTLEKVELQVFFMYLHSSKLSPTLAKKFEGLFRREYIDAVKCVREISGEKNLLWYRPWLETSIGLRSPLIHPLNALQLIALDKKDIKLLRETVTGIASGMLTTG